MGDVIRANGETRLVTAVGSNTSLTVYSPFDTALPVGTTYERLEVALVENVISNTQLTVTPAWNHAVTAGSTYERIGVKPTRAAWETANNFAVPDAEAAYYNGGDLGFGRLMRMKQTGSDVAYAVANYGVVGTPDPGQATVAALVAQGTIPDNRFATVSMEYTAHPILGGGRYTKFYVYGGDDARVLVADLDGFGQKGFPRLCVICHGGNIASTDSRGALGTGAGAQFIPFDLPTFGYSGLAGYTRADQEAQFKILNAGILATNPKPALQEMTEGSYGGAGLPAATFQDSFVPSPGWTGGFNQVNLYSQAVKKACRGCHITRDAPIDWATFSSFDSYSGFIKYLTCTGQDMPQAKVTFDNFWFSTSPSQPGVMANSGLSGWAPLDPCPDC